MTIDLYCKIYIDADCSHKALLSDISEFLKHEASVRTIETELFDLNVVTNNDAYRGAEIEDGRFLDYPYYLEIDPTSKGESNVEKFITSMSELLIFLFKTYKDAVPSCDYESLMPLKGI